MSDELEIVAHSKLYCKAFLVNLIYRTPHLHKDFELGILLDGEVRQIFADGEQTLKKGDFWLVNPYQRHELLAENPALIMSLQVSPQFFMPYYPVMSNVYMEGIHLHPDHASYPKLTEYVFRACRLLLAQPERYELKGVSLINYIFDLLLEQFPYHIVSEKEKGIFQTKGSRMRRITQYIDENYTQKLLLSDIAEHENLTLSYLSHFFKDSFGMTFQEYLTRIRCEKARQMLLLTDLSLLDISISCGFSDTKYFNKGFQNLFGCTPKEYRYSFMHAGLNSQQQSMLSVQKFLSPSAGLVTLDRYMVNFMPEDVH